MKHNNFHWSQVLVYQNKTHKKRRILRRKRGKLIDQKVSNLEKLHPYENEEEENIEIHLEKNM